MIGRLLGAFGGFIGFLGEESSLSKSVGICIFKKIRFYFIESSVFLKVGNVFKNLFF